MTYEQFEEIKQLLIQQNEELRLNNSLLKQQLTFWTQIVSDEYFEEMLKRMPPS